MRIETFNKKKSVRRAWRVGAYLGIIFLFLPLLCNNVPLLMRFEGEYYFPAFISYTEKDFSGTLLSEPRYSEPEFQKKLTDRDFCLWALVRYSPTYVDESLAVAPSPPEAKHWLGTDCRGQDVLVELLYALRQDIFIAICTICLAAFLGCVLGCVQGYIGGSIDFVVQRILEVWSSVPEIIIMLFLLEVHSCTLWSFIVWIALFHITHFSNVARMQVLRIRHFNYVLAARVMGFGEWHIFRHHVIPSTLGLIYAKMPFQAASALGVLFAITILRGSITKIPSIGDLIYQGRMYLCAPWILISAVVFLMIFVSWLSFCASRLQAAQDLKGKDDES